METEKDIHDALDERLQKIEVLKSEMRDLMKKLPKKQVYQGCMILTGIDQNSVPKDYFYIGNNTCVYKTYYEKYYKK